MEPATGSSKEEPTASTKSDNSQPDEARHAHFDCFSGAAGDMMLAACLDAAAKDAPSFLDDIQLRLQQVIPDEFHIRLSRVHRGSGQIAAAYVLVESAYNHAAAPVPHHDHSHQHTHDQSHSHAHKHGHYHIHDHDASDGRPLRNFVQIRDMIQCTDDAVLPPWVKATTVKAFEALARAEAYVHGVDSIENVHFHEVGAIDSIVDTVGTCLALHLLGIRSVTCSPLPLGQGSVRTDHGLLPVPAPATLKLLEGMQVKAGPPGDTGELVTPTAAALLRVVSEGHRPPDLQLECIGVGAGNKDFTAHPNVLRVLVGRRPET